MTSENQSRLSKDHLLLLLILAVAAFLRLYHLGGSSLSNDELSALVRTEFNSLNELIDRGIRVDAHPAGVQIFMYYWIKVWGTGEAALRFPFALAGILSVLLACLLGRRWFGSLNGLLAASALAVLQFPILYSQIARPYAPGLLFTLSAAWCWTLVLFGRNKTPDAVNEVTGDNKNAWPVIGLGLSLAACAYTHYFSMLMAGIIALSGLAFLDKRNYRRYLLACLSGAVLFLPHLPIFFRQLSYGGVGEWLGAPRPGFLGRFFDYGLNDSTWIKISFLVLCVVPLIAFPAKLKKPAFFLLCIAWYLLPYFIGAWYSNHVNPVLQYSTLLFSFPFLLLFLSGFVPDEKVTGLARSLLVVFILTAGTLSTVAEKKYYSTNHFGVFKELAANMVKWNKTYPGNITTAVSVTNPKYLGYYFNREGFTPPVSMYQVADDSALARLRDLVDSAPGKYFAYGWSNMTHFYEAVDLVRAKYPNAVEQHVYFNSTISLYGKQGSGALPATPLFHSETSYETNHWSDEENKRSNEKAHTGQYAEMLENREFSLTWSKKLRELAGSGNAVISFTAWFNTSEPSSDGSLVMSFEADGRTYLYAATAVKPYNHQPGSWQKIILTKQVPEEMSGNGEVKFYFWNPDKKKIFIDDLSVTVRDTSYYR